MTVMSDPGRPGSTMRLDNLMSACIRPNLSGVQPYSLSRRMMSRTAASTAPRSTSVRPGACRQSPQRACGPNIESRSQRNRVNPGGTRQR
ncbi:Uncharacterised protein [Mycobacteroides abscessus subsp. abscessus]|nr:Uncharacterised protein [Mycobacteroides abscessus subsp. abscessus]